jgi:hypothetical protein
MSLFYHNIIKLNVKVQLSDLYSSMVSLFELISEMGSIKTPRNFHYRFSNLTSAATQKLFFNAFSMSGMLIIPYREDL